MNTKKAQAPAEPFAHLRNIPPAMWAKVREELRPKTASAFEARKRFEMSEGIPLHLCSYAQYASFADFEGERVAIAPAMTDAERRALVKKITRANEWRYGAWNPDWSAS